jgi:hypothetical protein
MRAVTARTGGAVALVVLCVSSAVMAAPKAPTPTANTGVASAITGNSATLNGTVNPNGAATTYYFEYGTTKSYGTQTPTQGPTGAVKQNIAATAAVGGLSAGVTYHFRLVASNAAGIKRGGDRTFKTSAGISLAAVPRGITVGGATKLAGQLTAAAPGGVKVTLEQDPAPYNVSDFKTVATATTDATGKFSFSQAPTTNTSYRVVTKTPDATSSTVVVPVRLRVAMAVSSTHPRRGKSVTFSGSVSPTRTGQLVKIQKRVGTRWRTVKSALLAPSSDPAASAYKVKLRIRKSGVFRAFVAGDVANATGTSRSRRISVR